jgi:hypothetical protein
MTNTIRTYYYKSIRPFVETVTDLRKNWRLKSSIDRQHERLLLHEGMGNDILN